jgi:Flp pilus assembly protein TadD
LNNRGWAYAQKGVRARAVNDYMSALKLNPDPRVRDHLETALKSLDIGSAKARGR